MIPERSAFLIFILRPTLPPALIAPCSSIAMLSIFSRFQGSCQLALLAISLVFDSSTTSTMRRRLARRELPVSVTSTIASTRSGVFTSVAPQENSTCASTPFACRYFFVICTTSVAIRFPCRSLTVLTGDSSWTASTHFTLRMLCFE